MNCYQIKELLDLYNKHRHENGLREGQSLMNALYKVEKSLYDKITGTNADPFYDDSKINVFWQVVNNG